MTGPDVIEYQARIEDPVVYVGPWTLRTTLHRVTQPGARIVEDECLEDANGVRHHVSPSDPRNLLKPTTPSGSRARGRRAEATVTNSQRTGIATALFLLALLPGAHEAPVVAQTPATGIAFVGGTLIDGTGAPPCATASCSCAAIGSNASAPWPRWLCQRDTSRYRPKA